MKLFYWPDYTQLFKFFNTIGIPDRIQETRGESHCTPAVRSSLLNEQPKPFWDASHFIPVSRSGLKCLFSAASVIFVLVILKCCSCSSVQTNIVFFFNKGRRGWHSCYKFGMNLAKWCTDPIKDRNFLGKLVKIIVEFPDRVYLNVFSHNLMSRWTSILPLLTLKLSSRRKKKKFCRHIRQPIEACFEAISACRITADKIKITVAGRFSMNVKLAVYVLQI